jgi:hypothetical protein
LIAALGLSRCPTCPDGHYRGKADVARAGRWQFGPENQWQIAVRFSLLRLLRPSSGRRHPVSEGDSTTVIVIVLADSPEARLLQPGDKILRGWQNGQALYGNE